MNQDPKTCRRLSLIARERLLWEELSLPSLQEGEVGVHTTRSAVSVGSEYAWFIGSERSHDLRPGSQLTFPRRMGYESLGVVIASRSQRAKVGDRVVSTYGHRTEAILSPADLLILVPAEMPDEVALLSILSCEASRGAEQAKCRPDSPIVITGAGAMGLLALHRLTWLGFQNITLVEQQPQRRKIAESLGARRVLSDKALPISEQFEFGLECSSNNELFRLLQQSMRRGGSICILADGNNGPLELDPLFHSNELTVQGSSDGADYEEYARHFFTHWREHHSPLSAIFDSYIPDAALIPEFAKMKDGHRPIKIMVSYGFDDASGRV